MKIFKNAQVLIDNQFVLCDFSVENGKFSKISEDINDFSEVIDLSNKKIIPGLIDIHTHGSYGVDFNELTPDSLLKVCSFLNSQGVTSVLPTILTDTEEKTIECLEIIVSAKENLGCDTILGVHLEGPFLSPAYKGAMPEHLLRLPDVKLFEKYIDASHGLVKLTTVSPELEGACEFASEITKKGVVVSLGHSGADQDTVLKFIKSGATNATHLGNAMKQQTQHNLNVSGSVLYTDVYSEVICDGFHVNPTVIDYFFKVRSHDKMILITDAVMAGGLPDGEYKLGVNDITVVNGDAKLTGKDVRAGSTLLAINAVKNVSKFINLPFEKCVKFMTENPAKSLNVFDKKGSIAVSKDADFVVLDQDLNIEQTYSLGKLVYQK
ncbi:MAG: N-acetylglucosamine-6-phosphate deacetylase [Clostridia bacterium]